MCKIAERDIDKILEDKNIPWSNFNGKTVLISGGTGLVGSLLAKTFLAYGKKNGDSIKVIVLARSMEKVFAAFGTEAQKIQVILGDVRDSICCNEKVDYIFHCASVTTSKYMITNPVETLMIAVKGTENLLKLGQAKKVESMVYLSSMEVYGTIGKQDNPVTEEKLGYVDLTQARSTYPEGKRVCELLCNAYFTQYGVNVKIARLAQTFGAGIPLTDHRVPMQFARSAINGEDIVLHTTGKSVSNFCYTSDSVRGLLTVLTKGRSGEAYNIANDKESRTIGEIAQLVAEKVADKKIKVIFEIPESNTYGYAPDVTLHLSSKKLEALGWKPQVDMESAYKRLIAYLRE